MTLTKMSDSNANVAVHVPVLTASTVRRCTVCAVLANKKRQKSGMFRELGDVKICAHT